MKIADDPDRYMVERPNGCIEWTRSRTAAGYGRFRLNGETVYAHRFAYERAYGPVPEGMYIMHSCDNPPCCNPFHLSAGTAADNAKDRDQKGRSGTTTHGKYIGYSKREKEPRIKLTDAQVMRVRNMLNKGLRGTEIAATLGISVNRVYKIKYGVSYQKSMVD